MFRIDTKQGRIIRIIK